MIRTATSPSFSDLRAALRLAAEIALFLIQFSAVVAIIGGGFLLFYRAHNGAL